MTEKEKALKIISQLEKDMEITIYTQPIPERDATAATLGRNGAFALAIIRIKSVFDLPLTD